MGITLRSKKYKSGTTTFYLDFYHNGIRKAEFLDIKFNNATPTHLKKEKKVLAENIRATRQMELESFEHGFIPKHRRNASFNDFYLNYLNNYKKKDKRMIRYSYEKFLEANRFKRLSAKQITPRLVEDFKNFLMTEAGLSGETPYDYFARFRKVLKEALRDGLISQTTYLSIQDIKAPKRENNTLKKQVLTVEELNSLKATPCGNEQVKRSFLFACFTGLGEAEIRKLTWSRILEEGKIRIFREKTGEQIINDLPKTALELIGDRGKSDDKIFILPSNVAIHKNLKSWRIKAQIEKHISFYCGRHTFAVLLLDNGANLKTVADCLGHSDTRHTVKYLNYTNKLKNKAIHSLPQLY